MDSGKARSRRVGGSAHFSQKSGHFRIFAMQIFGLPPPFGHPPLINAGGQDLGFFDRLKRPQRQLGAFCYAFQASKIRRAMPVRVMVRCSSQPRVYSTASSPMAT